MTDSAKYLIHAAIAADGVVERSDVVGAVYGQTEGLLGEELDLRRLQESSKLGRIDVQIETSGGQSVGEITIATSLDRVETATLAAALETIDRVGPCRATVEVTELEDVRAAKRRRVIDRAQRLLLEEFEETTSDAIVDEVRRRVATADVTSHEGLPAGPRVADGDAMVVVEGRADVQAVLAAGVKNAIAVEGTDVPESVAELTRDRTTTAFLDGDRGGELILRELCQVGDVDHVAFAPTGRSVEDLSRSEVLGSLRNTVAVDAIDDAATIRDLVDAARDRATGRVEPSDAETAADDPEAAAAESTDAAPDDADAEGARAPGAGTATADEAVVADGAAATSPGDAAAQEKSATATTVDDDTATPDDGGAVASDASSPVEQLSTPSDGGSVEAAEAGDETHTDGGTEAARPPEPGDAGTAGEAPAPSDDGATSDDGAASAHGAASADEGVASPDDGTAATGEGAAATDDGPQTIHEHVESVRETDQARLLDDERSELQTVPAAATFETLADTEVVPATVVLDARLEQRLLDLAAQRGVREVVAASLGSFTKRPTDVRLRTMADLQPE